MSQTLRVDFPPECPHCPKCGCGIVLLQQKSLDDRCAECFRMDRMEEIANGLIGAAQKIQVACRETREALDKRESPAMCEDEILYRARGIQERDKP